MTASKGLYRVVADGWVTGVQRRAGDLLRLTPRQARYLGAVVAPAEAKPAKPDGKAGRRPRRRRKA